jgi:signal transduction histidine kinase
MRELFKIPSTEEVRESLLRMHEGMDRAINDAMHRYASRREEVRERFITILGHDLRDPLSTVMISANMLAANPGLKSEQRMIAEWTSLATQEAQARTSAAAGLVLQCTGRAALRASATT